jgi:microcin C transport system substrate-binding protein
MFFAVAGPAAQAEVKVFRGHGLAMHGGLKYPENFKHFDYVNPDAPKGGDVRLATTGGFDSFNPFIIGGRPAAGVAQVFDTLMESSADEPFSMYCLICETIEVPEDRSWVAFYLNPKARWHDGKPITVDDVIWSFNTLFEKGAPFYRFYYGSVSKVEKVGSNGVKFSSRARTGSCRSFSVSSTCCRSITGRRAISARRRSSRRSAAAPTGLHRSRRTEASRWSG